MLEDMRRHSRSTLIYVLFGILIAVFVLTFNTASRLGDSGNMAVESMAEVAGATIDSGELNLAMLMSADPPPAGADPFQKFQSKQRYEATRLFASGVSPEMMVLTPHAAVPATKIEKVLNELVESVLVSQDAKQLGLAVSDVELTRRVIALLRANGVEVADENGNYDPKKYDNFVRVGLGTTRAALEELLRREILRDKMAAIVTQGVVVAPSEVDALFAADSKRPKLEVLTLDAGSAAKAVVVSDADATAFADANADKIAAAYKADEAKYKVPDKFNLRAILVAAPNPADESDDAKKQEATTARAGKKAAADAIKADLDKAWNGEVKLDPVAAKGEDSDKPAVGEAKTATEVTGDEKNARLIGYFSKVAGEKTEDNMYKEAGGNYVDDLDGEALDGRFGPAVKAAVTAAQAGQLVGPVEGKKGWWVIAVEKKLPGKTTELADARVEIAKGLLQKEKAEKELESIAQAVLLAAQGTPTTALADVVKDWAKKKGIAEDSLSVTETPPLGKSPMEAMAPDLSAMFGGLPKVDSPDDVPGVGKNPELAKAAWTLTNDKPVAAQLFKSEDGKSRYVVRLSTKAVGDAATDGKLKTTLARNLNTIRRQEAYRAYVAKLVAEAKAAGKVKTTEAFALKLKQEQAKVADELKKTEADKPAAEAGPGGGLQLKVGDQPVKLDLKNVEKPVEKPAEKPAAPAPAADKPAEKPAEPVK